MRRSEAYRIIVNKIKEQLVSRREIALSCCGDQGRSRDVRRLHSPINLKPLEAAGWGDSWCRCFFMCCLFVVVGWGMDAGCGFECTLLVPKVRTILY